MGLDVFDAIIVGAGRTGPALAARCRREVLKTAIIERHHFGGASVNVGRVSSFGAGTLQAEAPGSTK